MERGYGPRGIQWGGEPQTISVIPTRPVTPCVFTASARNDQVDGPSIIQQCGDEGLAWLARRGLAASVPSRRDPIFPAAEKLSRHLRNARFRCPDRMKQLFFLAFLSVAWSMVAAQGPYDFRASEAYAKLSTLDKRRLEQVYRDLVLLWGALDIYADQHDGSLPETLDTLVPRYLSELPADPFATQQTGSEPMTHGYTASKGGLGYRFKRGAPGNRAWVVSSVGLPDFPYLAASGNVGLYICKGEWISGKNPVRIM